MTMVVNINRIASLFVVNGVESSLEKWNMSVEFSCDECGSTSISSEGYCTKCGLYYLKDIFQGAFWQWSTCDLGEIKGDASHGYKVGIPWVQCNAPVLDRMMDYPEAIEFLESKMVTSYHPINLGDYTVAPARAWRVDSWKSACRQLLERKCRLPDCYKMVHVRDSGRSTKTKLCLEHMNKYLRLSPVMAMKDFRAKE